MNSTFGGITREGFVEYNHGKSAHNRFVSENMKTAFDLTGEVPVIDYSLQVIAKGSMPMVRVMEGMVGDVGITIHYKTGLGLPKVSADDEIVAIAKNAAGELLIGRQARGNGDTGTLFVSSKCMEKSEIVCCYVFALSADGKKSSNRCSWQPQRVRSTFESFRNIVSIKSTKLFWVLRTPKGLPTELLMNMD